MALSLPIWPSPAKMTPRLVTARNDLSPAFGGPTNRFSRMGSRYALDVEMPPMRYIDALDWADLEDEADTCVMLIPQPGLDTGSPGVPRVNGAAQAGSSLILDGLTPHYALRKHQWLTVTTGGQMFNYRAKSAVVADAAGNLTVPLRTMLRVPPANNDVVEIAEPKIQGYVTVTEDAWSVDAAHIVALTFTITERE